MATSAKIVPPITPAVQFRSAIETAEREGVKRGEMMLRLTLRDASDLRRDRTLAIEDISYAAGGMRFLGVEVTAGGVTVSRLDHGDAAAA